MLKIRLILRREKIAIFYDQYHSEYLPTRSICLSTRITRSTVCRSFYNWSLQYYEWKNEYYEWINEYYVWINEHYKWSSKYYEPPDKFCKYEWGSAIIISLK